MLLYTLYDVENYAFIVILIVWGSVTKKKKKVSDFFFAFYFYYIPNYANFYLYFSKFRRMQIKNNVAAWLRIQTAPHTSTMPFTQQHRELTIYWIHVRKYIINPIPITKICNWKNGAEKQVDMYVNLPRRKVTFYLKKKLFSLESKEV